MIVHLYAKSAKNILKKKEGTTLDPKVKIEVLKVTNIQKVVHETNENTENQNLLLLIDIIQNQDLIWEKNLQVDPVVPNELVKL